MASDDNLSAPENVFEPNIWAKVLRIVKDALLSVVRNPDAASAWLDRLVTTVDGQRLAISLAIDLAVGAYTEQTRVLVGAILDEVDVSVAPEASEFGRRLENHPRRSDLHCASRFAASNSADGYVTIISLLKFIACAGSSLGLANTAEDKALLRKRHGKAFRARALRGYGTWWTGESRIVWITCARRFIDKWATVNPDRRASEVQDALGLVTPSYIGAGVPLEYVAVQYPASFDGPAYQPTTLDAWWPDPGQWYISFPKQDAWGRARSISGNHEPQVERIHQSFMFERVGADYGLWYLGTASTCSADSPRLVQAGLELVHKL